MQHVIPSNSTLADHLEQDVAKRTVEPLSALRSDLQLLPAEYNCDGLPNWTLYDPVRGKFYRIGWVEFELLKRWEQANATSIVDQVNQETTIRVTSKHVDDLQNMLIENELVEAQSIDEISRLLKNKHARRVSIVKQLFTFALFYRKPLLNPDTFLEKMDRYSQPVFRHKTVMLYLLSILTLFVGFGLVSHAYELKDTLVQYMNPTGFLYFTLVLILTNILHEIGHGVVAKHYGCSVRCIGVALIFMLPVCYCDTTDAWRLKNPRKRLLINAAGMAAEALLALMAAVMWFLLPDGIFRTLAFFIAVTSLGTTLFINLNPFLKFDGYYLLADSLQIDNFQKKSFSTMRWQLRSWVLGRHEAKPFQVTRIQKNIMCIYAAATWTYRLFLYQVIALMVYQFWFKVLGVVMMVGVVCTMIIQPVTRELAIYIRSARTSGVNPRVFVSCIVFSVFLILFLVPLPRMVSAPAVLSASNVERFYAPMPSMIKTIHVQVGDQIKKGEVLFELENPEYIFRRDMLLKEIELLNYQLSRQATWVDTDNDHQVTQNDLQAKMASLKDIQQNIARLKIYAIDDGQVVMLPSWLQSGTWVEQNEVLAEATNQNSPEVRAYVSAKHIEHIRDAAASFHVFSTNVEIPLETTSVSTASINVLTDESLAIIYGGDIAVDQSNNGDLIPVQDWHQLKFDTAALTSIDREQKGYVSFKAEPRSMAASVVSQTYGALIRESGF